MTMRYGYVVPNNFGVADPFAPLRVRNLDDIVAKMRKNAEEMPPKRDLRESSQ
jgi:hypothetical protein